MAEVFISYARKDKGFVRDLHAALQKVNRDTWVDWRSIPESAKWRAQIFAAIEAADNFLFIISPDSVKSWMCGEEISNAVANNKRLITILYHSVERAELHSALAEVQWIDYPELAFEQTFERLIKALDSNLEWEHKHTQLQLVAFSTLSLEQDLERSILLAMRAVDATRATDGTVIPEAEDALHRAILRSSIRSTLTGPSSRVARPSWTSLAPVSILITFLCFSVALQLWASDLDTKFFPSSPDTKSMLSDSLSAAQRSNRRLMVIYQGTWPPLPKAQRNCRELGPSSGGSAPASAVSGPAQCSHHITACATRRVAFKRPSTPEAPAASLPSLPLRLLPGGANQFPGGTFNPRQTSALTRRTNRL